MEVPGQQRRSLLEISSGRSNPLQGKMYGNIHEAVALIDMPLNLKLFQGEKCLC